MLEVLWNVDSGDSRGANYAGIERRAGCPRSRSAAIPVEVQM
jgi:hypothetical protein